MSDLELWRQANEQYLATALSEQRARLTRLATAATDPPKARPAAATPPVSRPDAPVPRSLLKKLFAPHGVAARPAGGERPPAAPPTQPLVARQDHPAPEPAPALSNGAGMEAPVPALLTLAERLGLNQFERDVLLLCAAMELEPDWPALCARAQGEGGRPYPNFALAMALFEPADWEAMSPERPLRYWRLLEINQPGAQPLLGSALKADERIVNYIKGVNYLDDRLAPYMVAVAAPADGLPPSQAAMADAVAARIDLNASAAAIPLVQLAGNDRASKLTVAGAAARQMGLELYRMAADSLPATLPEQDTLLRLWQRECVLMPVALLVDASGMEPAHALARALQRMFGHGMGVAMLDTREPWPLTGHDSVIIDIAKPTAREQCQLWARIAGLDQLAPRLAAQFNFNHATIVTLAARGRQLAALPSAPLEHSVWQECLREARPAMNQLAQPLQAKAGWDELELPPEEKRLLRQVADQVGARMTVYQDWGFGARMSRGLGISVLFAGESGTGKTMAAEVLARDLDLLLYRIDLSAVVSKYIGETEKNLRTLFDAAEDGGAVLFFDEADALFGKRSEVKDSHDRYANIEVSYLLQRMEAYRGLAILATNSKSALDTAFVRRLRFIVQFPFPGVQQRVAIWRHMFPAQSPLGELDFQRLARLNVSGGNISNIALNAAFLAARTGGRITMPLVLEAARNEFRKMERPVNEGDFRWLETAGG